MSSAKQRSADIALLRSLAASAVGGAQVTLAGAADHLAAAPLVDAETEAETEVEAPLEEPLDVTQEEEDEEDRDHGYE